MEVSEAIQQLQYTGRYLLEHGLTWGNAGNLSIRLDAERYLITASGTQLGELSEADFVECTLDGKVLSGKGRPSKETPMHRAVYEQRPSIQAVLHAAPFYSTLVSCSRLELPGNWFVEDMYYLERVARVPYFHPGSVELGEAVRAQARQANVLLLDNHGVLVYDTTAREALMALHTLEVVARMLITARSAGVEMLPLSAEQVQDFLKNSGYRPPRDWSV